MTSCRNKLGKALGKSIANSNETLRASSSSSSTSSNNSSASASSSDTDNNNNNPSSRSINKPKPKMAFSSNFSCLKFPYEMQIVHSIEQFGCTGNYQPLLLKLAEVYSSVEILSSCFRNADVASSSCYHSSALRLKPRLAVDSHSDETTVDLEALRGVHDLLNELQEPAVYETISNNMLLLTESMTFSVHRDWEQLLHCLVICFDVLTNPSFCFISMSRALPKLCYAACNIPVKVQARLARVWAKHFRHQLETLLQCLQVLITQRVVSTGNLGPVHENYDIRAITKVLKIVYYANILAGEVEKPKMGMTAKTIECCRFGPSISMQQIITSFFHNDMSFYAEQSQLHQPKFIERHLDQELGVTSLQCRKPLIPFDQFYNEQLSDAIYIEHDYIAYRNLLSDPSLEDRLFSFMLYSFILTPITKFSALYYDNHIRMRTEETNTFTIFRRNEPFQAPLRLRIRRDNIVNDALIGLGAVANCNPRYLKKRLVVEFMNEQGVDQGGLSKEFFQLFIEEIFKPDYDMFVVQDDTNNMWFNFNSSENEDHFTLVGIILGLAIYNNVILPVNFPNVVYRKLMDAQGTFHDLADWSPILYRSLKLLLDYDEADIYDVFMQTFKISYTNMYGEVLDYELVPGGDNIKVEQHNKKQFVDYYTDFLLNKSVSKQFQAFRNGFVMVTDETPLKLLFRPEEIELLVCGSKNFDFKELESSTSYEGGYTRSSSLIKDFWKIVHAMSEESKRKLLDFATGSNRIPLGGLGKLKLSIIRLGPDSDRLPISHTCFNALLLPEYSSKEKLKERLYKAINYSKGSDIEKIKCKNVK